MANGDDSAWRVLGHGPIEKLSENLWRVVGDLPGMSLKRVMTVFRRKNGELVIHSAIALAGAAQRELEAWGRPAVMLVPNGGHRLDAARYKARYPELKVYAPRGSMAAVAKKVPVNGAYNDFAGDEEVWLETLHCVAEAEGAMLARSQDGLTLVLNDVMFNMDRKRDVLGFLFTTILGSAPGPRVSRLAKLVYVKEQSALRADFLRYAQLPDLQRVIVAHEKVAHGRDARPALERAATYLRA